MDNDGGLNMHNWGYYESPPIKSHLGPPLKSNMEDQKPLLGSRDSTYLTNVNGGFNLMDCRIPSSHHYPINVMRDAWIPKDTKFFSMLPSNPNYTVLPEMTSSHHHPVQMMRQIESSISDRFVPVDGSVCESNDGPAKKRAVPKTENAPKPKKSRKSPNATIKDGNSALVVRAKPAKRSIEVVINGIEMDISSLPIPVCSCTGAPQQCYRWGFGGWQSACCTTGMSMYPLPMSTKRRGARIAGRKMSLGAFKKVLEKLAAEGYNFSNSIDLKTYWAKHGTNKFVTIR